MVANFQCGRAAAVREKVGMNELQRLRERQEEAKGVILRLRNAIAKEDRDFNTEERAEWEKANKDYDSLGSRIEAHERGAAVESANRAAKDNKPAPADVAPIGSGDGKRRSAEELDELRALAFQGWVLRTFKRPISNDHKRAAKIVGLDLRSGELDVRLPRRPGAVRAQGVGTGAAGGYTVPTTLVSTIEYGMKMWNACRTAADVFRTETGNPYDWPTVNDTGNVGALLAENTTVGAAVDITFAKTTFGAYKFSSTPVLVSAELEQDNAVDLANQIGTILGERLGRGQEGYFTTGTGTNQPAGIVTGATAGLTAASATAIAPDELFTLYHSVDPAYRNDPSFGWMMHDNVAMALRKLKDTQNRYLWEINMQVGQPALLLGRPVTINQSMASAITTGQKTILCGAMSKFKIRDAGGVRFVRLNERYADLDQIGFFAFLRSDSKVLNPGTNPIKYLVQL
jgi:HK97 family phage major capsid protein